MNKPTITAIVPARSGSKGIYKKNIRELCGRPLLYYQINHALNVDLIDEVILATDSEEFADVGRRWFGDRISIVMRPADISHDNSKTEDTLLYVMETKDPAPDDIVVTLEPTNPLNRPEHIRGCIDKLLEEGFDSACCVIEDIGFFLDTPEDIEHVRFRPMKKDIKPRLRETGNCWVTRFSALKENNNRLAGEIGTVTIPTEDSIHLDHEMDFRIADALLGPRNSAKHGRYFTPREAQEDPSAFGDSYWVGAVDPDGNFRDKTAEREKRLKECSEEIAFINSLESGRVLDVGCGLGFLLSGIDEEWEKHGVEISSFAAARAEKYGKIFNGMLEDAAYEDNFFDVVVLYHVIEHLADPAPLIEEIRRILKPGGKLILGTPDFECGVAKRFGENFRLLNDKTHVSLFSSVGVTRMLTEHLFEVDELSCPYFETEHFTAEAFERLSDPSKMSPPFYGNVITVYAHKK